MKRSKTAVDIVDIKNAVQRGCLRVFERNGFYMLEDTISGEVVRLNECKEVTHQKSYFDDSELSGLGF